MPAYLAIAKSVLRPFLVSVCFFACGVATVLAVTLPLASTVAIDGGAAPEGAVVSYNETAEQFTQSQQSDSPYVYGVVAAQPAIVLETSSTSPTVITQGVTRVRVDTSTGAIVRGDLLTTSEVRGVARKASSTDANVFAIALEDYSGGVVGVIDAEVNQEKAQSVLQQTVAAQTAQEANGEDTTASWLRSIVAVLVVVGGIGFLLWSYRTMFVSGITSIGRNPRATQAVWVTTIGGIALGVVLLAIVVFIALGVLVLPIA